MPIIKFRPHVLVDQYGDPLTAAQGEVGTLVREGTDTAVTIQDWNGNPMGNPVTADQWSRIPAFQVVDDADEVHAVEWVWSGGRQPVESTEGLRVAAQEAWAAAAAAASAASSALVSAQAAANLVSAPADNVTAALVGTSGSLTRQAIDALIDAVQGVDLDAYTPTANLPAVIASTIATIDRETTVGSGLQYTEQGDGTWVLDVADRLSAPTLATVAGNTQTGTSYTLVLADAGRAVEMDSAGANTLTIPTNAAVAFPVGTVVEVLQLGAGATTIAAASGVTLRAPSGATLAGQYATVSLRKRGANEWVLAGAVA